MSINLTKGGNVSLEKEVPGLKKIAVGLGWDIRESAGPAYDLDASAFLLTEAGTVRSREDFVYYGHLKNADGSVLHTGDNLTGEGDGDDETIMVTLDAVAADIQKIAIVVTIHQAEERGNQNFGQVASAFIRIVDCDTKAEIARFDLSEDASMSTGMIFGELYRHADGWKFRAIGEGVQGGLKALAAKYGVSQ